MFVVYVFVYLYDEIYIVLKWLLLQAKTSIHCLYGMNSLKLHVDVVDDVWCYMYVTW